MLTLISEKHFGYRRQNELSEVAKVLKGNTEHSLKMTIIRIALFIVMWNTGQPKTAQWMREFAPNTNNYFCQTSSTQKKKNNFNNITHKNVMLENNIPSISPPFSNREI